MVLSQKKKEKKNAMVGFVYLKYPFVDMLKWDLREMKLKERLKKLQKQSKKEMTVTLTLVKNENHEQFVQEML